jgi:hypothetical protein
MIEEILIFFIVLIASGIARYITGNIPNNNISITSRIIFILTFIGVAVHEFSHYLANLIVGLKPGKIEIKWKNEKYGFISPHGSVQGKPRSFLQAVIICLAPLYLSTWLIFLTFLSMLNPDIHIMLRIISGILCISLFIGASPSGIDFGNIFRTFNKDIFYSLYQIFLIILSGITLWLILSFTDILFVLDILYYLSIAGLYWMFKLSFLGVDKIFRVSLHHNSSELNIRNLTRRRYKPKKPYKLNIEELPW